MQEVGRGWLHCRLRTTAGEGARCRRVTQLRRAMGAGAIFQDSGNGRRSEVCRREEELLSSQQLLLRALTQGHGPLHKAQPAIGLAGESWGKEYEADQRGAGHSECMGV